MKVSVPICAYNHENYIAQAIESVLAQEVDFEYEIVIGDDCSTDGTVAIIKQYQRDHPGKIRLIENRENLGWIKNDVLVHRSCNGEYLAALEGDDYWISKDKLARQVAFLDENPLYPCCFHDVEAFNDVGDREPSITPSPYYRRDLAQEDLLDAVLIYVCSLMYRRTIVSDEFLDRYANAVVGDYEFYVMLTSHGPMGYIEGLTSAYRRHVNGYSGKPWREWYLNRVGMYQFARRELAPRHNHLFRQIISDAYYDLCIRECREKEWADARKYLLKSIRVCPLNSRILIYRIAKPFFNKLIGRNSSVE